MRSPRRWRGRSAWSLRTAAAGSPRLRGGFTVGLTVALVGSGVVTTVLLGTWAYQEARRAVFGQLLEGLANVDRVAEGELLADVRLNVQKMSNVGRPRPDHRRGAGPRGGAGKARGAPEIQPPAAADQPLRRRRQGRSSFPPPRATPSRPTASAPRTRWTAGRSFPIRTSPRLSIAKCCISACRSSRRAAAATPSAGSGCGTTCRTRSACSSRPPGSAIRVMRYCSTTTARYSPTTTPSRVGEDLSAYPAFAQASAGRSGWLIAPNGAGRPAALPLPPAAQPGHQPRPRPGPADRDGRRRGDGAGRAAPGRAAGRGGGALRRLGHPRPRARARTSPARWPTCSP